VRSGWEEGRKEGRKERSDTNDTMDGAWSAWIRVEASSMNREEQEGERGKVEGNAKSLES
jgi:hypothetical protein